MTANEVLEAGLNLGSLNMVQLWLDSIILEVFPNLDDSRILYRDTPIKGFGLFLEGRHWKSQVLMVPY